MQSRQLDAQGHIKSGAGMRENFTMVGGEQVARSADTGIEEGYKDSFGQASPFGMQASVARQASGARAYVVQEGDTLQRIAQAVWGDSSLWYLIAEANGLTNGSAYDPVNNAAGIRAGQVLTLPDAASVGAGSRSSASTLRPYDPTEAIGNTAPNLPPPRKKAAFWKKLVVAIIAIVMSVVLPGVGGAIVASLFSQTAAVALGVQDSISWKQVALSAVSAGVSGGLKGVNFTGGDLGSFGNVVARAAVGNVITQGLGVATGLQQRFDWRGVAASAVGAGIGHAVGEALGLPADGSRPKGMDVDAFIGKSFVKGFAAGLGAAVARGGKIVVQQVAVDAFGNALGYSLADAATPQTQGVGPWSDKNYVNEMDRASDNYNPAFAHDYRNQMDRASDAYNPAFAYDYRNQMDRASDAYNPAFEHGYRNAMDQASDSFNPATLYRYRNGSDVASDRVHAVRQWRERMARAVEGEKAREFNRFASGTQASGATSPPSLRDLRKLEEDRINAVVQARIDAGPRMTSWDPAADARKAVDLQRTRNNIAMAAGGPFVAAPMAAIRYSGFNEFEVEQAGMLATSFMDVYAPRGGVGASTLARVRGSKTVTQNNSVGNSFDEYVVGTKLRGLDERGLLIRQEHLPTPNIDGKNYVKPDYSILRQDGRGVAAYADAKSGADIPFDAQARGLIEWSTTTKTRTLIYYTPDGTTPISPHLLNYASLTFHAPESD